MNDDLRLFELLGVSLLFVLLTAWLRWDSLGLGFYWDELGYYSQFAYTFFENNFRFHLGWIPPVSYKPPLFPYLIAGLSKLLGWTILSSRLVVFIFGGYYLSGTYALARLWLPKTLSTLTVLSLACSPVFLSQAGLAQPDLPMAALAAWALYFLFRGRLVLSSVFYALGVATNGTLLALAPLFAWISSAAGAPGTMWSRRRLGRGALFLFPALVLLLAWVLYALPFQRKVAEAVVEGLNYNSIFLLGPVAVLKRFAHRIVQIFLLDGRSLLTLACIGGILFGWKRHLVLPRHLLPFGVLLALETVFLSLFGVTHQRYFLVALPSLFVMGALSLQPLLPHFKLPPYSAYLLPCLVAAWGLWAWSGVPNKYTGIEYRRSYTDSVRLSMSTAKLLERTYPDHLVLAYWPLTDAFSRPFLFHVSRPLNLIDLEAKPSEKSRQLFASMAGRRIVAYLPEPAHTEEELQTALGKLGPALKTQCHDEYFGSQILKLCVEVIQ